MQAGNQRQQIREQLGMLEERLEELGALASANERASLRAPDAIGFGTEILLQETLESMRALGQLVNEQQLSKSVSAHDFLQKVIALLVQDAAAQGCELAVSHYSEGKISMEMAELVMGAVVAGFRASLRSHKALTKQARLKHHLFPIGSVYIELRASPGEIQFRLVDDGKGFDDSDAFAAGGAADKQFDKLREHIARSGGWLGRGKLGSYGGVIDFKVPLAHTRVEAMRVRRGSFEALLPGSCVAEVLERGSPGKVPDGALVLRPCEVMGLVPGDSDAPVLVRLGVADLQFWVACDAVPVKVLARRASAGEFTDPGSWLQCLGLFHEKGEACALPLFEGAALVRFYRENFGVHA